jgi:hypothetical protein
MADSESKKRAGDDEDEDVAENGNKKLKTVKEEEC